MAISTEQLQNMIYDPARMQSAILAYIESDDANRGIVDATNPATMLLESAVATASASASETYRSIRMKYPDLALTDDELIHHISDEELTSMFAVPSSTYFYFYLNVVDLRMYGIKKNNYKEIVIPIGTVVTILDTKFTLLNDITVKLFNNGFTLVEQSNNDNDLAIDDVGIIDSAIVTDKEGFSFVFFKALVKQVSRYVSNTATTIAEGFDHIYNIDDKYCHAEVYFLQNNSWVKMHKAHNDEYINPSQPTAFITILDGSVRVRIPDIYFHTNMISNNIKVELYDTKGELYLPINEYTPSDFSVSLGDTGKSSEAAASTNVAILANSGSIVDGGKNSSTFTELRESIIYNSVGDIDLPVTDYQLARSAVLSGYTVNKVVDVVTSRAYIANKNGDKLVMDGVQSTQDVYFNTLRVTLAEIQNLSTVKNFDKAFLIKSNTWFKDNNSITSIVTDDEVNEIRSLSMVSLVDRMQQHKYFYTPFYYWVSHSDGYINAAVYDLDNPSIDHMMIANKNIDVTPVSVNINRYDIKKTEAGYRIYLELKGSGNYSALEPSKIRLQAVIPIEGSTVVYIDGSYNAATEQYEIDIDTKLDMSREGMFDISNGYSTLTTKYSKLTNTISIYTYTIDPDVISTTNFLKAETYNLPNRATILTKENLTITFGKQIKYIWNKVANSYTARKYKQYTDTKYLTYEKDVYEINKDTGSIYFKEGNKLVKHKLHAKGEQVLDPITKKPIVEHVPGDTILIDGNPVIDIYSGVLRFIDICMLELEYQLATTLAYRNYTRLVLNRIRKYAYEDMGLLNKKVLENTAIYYKTTKSTTPVTTMVNNVPYTVPYSVTPTVVLYSTSTSTYEISDILNMTKIVGGVIDTILNSDLITMKAIKDECLSKLGSNFVAMKIEGLDTINSERIIMGSKFQRLSLNKKMYINRYDETEVIYNINLTIQYV